MLVPIGQGFDRGRFYVREPKVIGPIGNSLRREGRTVMQELFRYGWRVNVTAYSPEQGLTPVRTSVTEASPGVPLAS